MNEKLAKLGIAALAFAAIAVPATFFASANAQQSPAGQGGPPAAGPAGQGGPGGQGGGFGGPGGGQFRPMGGGGGAIAVDSSGVYVLQGNKVFKMDKNSLKVVQEGDLPAPMGMPGGPGQGGRGGFGGGGAGGAGGGGFGGGGQRGGGGGFGGGGESK